MTEDQKDTFTIFQLKDDESLRYYRFEALDSLKAYGLKVERDHYREVWSTPLEEGVTLDDLFFEFGTDIPDGFQGHSMSVSDIIVLNQAGEEKAYYVDRIGFTEVPEFMDTKERAAYALGDRFIALDGTDTGIAYKILDENHEVLKEGNLDARDMASAMQQIEEALKQPIYDKQKDEFLHTREQGNIRQSDQPRKIDYGRLMDKVGHGARNRDIVREFREETKKKFKQQNVEGESIETIEANVKDYVSTRLAEYGIDAQVIDVILTGSRARGIERPGSDLDVIVSFAGSAREEELYDLLHEDTLIIGGATLDINPISAERTATLEEFLPREAEYLRIREQEHEKSQLEISTISEHKETTSGHDVQKSEEYKPLAKVEELEEENYNQIDNYLSNTVNKEEKKHPQQEKQIEEDKKKIEKTSIRERIAEKKAQLAAQRGEAVAKKATKNAENAEIKDMFS